MRTGILLLLVLLPAVISASASDAPQTSRGYIVVYSGKTYSSGALSSAGLVPVYHFRVINADYVIPSKAGTAAVAVLEKSPEVRMIVPDYYIQAVPPADTQERIFENLNESVAQIGAVNVQYQGTVLSGKGVKVAVIDTGINYSHADLGNCTTTEFLAGNCSKVVGGYDFVNGDSDPMDDNGHGTHCAGIIAANGSIRGVAPNATLIAIKVLNSQGGGYISDLLKGIDYAYQEGADVVSMSLGWNTLPKDAQDVLSLAVEGLYKHDVTPVVAAGNDGSIGSAHGPAMGLHAITVGAVDSSNGLASFSSRGPDGYGTPYIDVLAPGVSINSTWINGGYTELSGTSMAAPHVAGAAALMKEAGKDPFKLVWSATDLGYSPVQQGHGLVNVSRALEYNLSYPISVRLEVKNTTGNSTTTLVIENDGPDQVSVNLSASDFTRIEGESCSPAVISSGNFSLSSSSDVIQGRSSMSFNLTVNLSSPVPPGYYQGFIIVNSSGYPSHKIPAILVVEEGGGTTLLNTTTCFSRGFAAPSYQGDSAFFKFSLDEGSGNGRSLYINVSWSGTGSDFDFYLTNLDTHELWVANADSSTTTSEAGWITDPKPGEYVLEVRAYSLDVQPKSVSVLVQRPLSSGLSLRVQDQNSLDFGYVDSSEGVSELNLTLSDLTGTEYHNITLSVLPAEELWSGEQVSVVSCNETAFTLGPGGQRNITCILNITGTSVSPGYYFGKINVTSNATSDLVEQYFFVVGIGTLGRFPVQATFPVNASILPPCGGDVDGDGVEDASSISARWHYYRVKGNRSNVCGVRYRVAWGNSNNELACYTESSSLENGFFFNTNDFDTAVLSGTTDSVTLGVHRIGVCLNEKTSYYYDSYNISLSLVYATHIAFVPDDTKTYYRYNESVNYSVYSYDENNLGRNFTADVRVYQPGGRYTYLHQNLSVNTSFNDSFVYGNNYVVDLLLEVDSNDSCGTNRILYIQSLGSINVTTDKTSYVNNETMYYNITLWDNRSFPMLTNETLVVTFMNETGSVWNQTTLHVTTSGSFNYSFPGNASPGNWTILVNDTYFGITAQTTVHLDVFYGVIINASNTSVQPNSTVLVPVTLVNNGTGLDTFNISFSQSLGWQATLTQNQLTLAGGEAGTVYLNVSVPFEYAGTVNNITVNVTGQHSQSSAGFTLNVSRVVGVAKYFDNTSVFNFSLPDVLTLQMKIRNTGNVNATYNLSASYPAGWNVTFNQTLVQVPWQDARNVTFNVSIPANATGETNISFSAVMVNETGWTEPAAVITFTVPEISLTASAPPVTSEYYYVNQTTGDRMVRLPAFTASDPADGVLNGSLALGNCTVLGRVFSLYSNGTGFWCEMNVSNLTGTSYSVTISMRDSRNHTGSKQVNVIVPQNLSFNARLSSSSVVKGNNFYVYGNASYDSSTPAQGTVYVTVGNNNCNSALSPQSGYSSFAVLCQAPASAGNYLVSVSYTGVWGLSGSRFLNLSVTEPPSTTESSLGGGGGGGGAVITSGGEQQAPEETEEPVSASPEIKQAAVTRDGWISVVLDNPQDRGLNVSVSVKEEGEVLHFKIPENISITLEPNASKPLRIPLEPLKYAVPGEYTLKILVGDRAVTVKARVPAPKIDPTRVNVFKYVEPSKNRTRVILNVYNPLNITRQVNVTETIPKQAAESVEQVDFDTPPARVIERDPVVLWTLNVSPGESVSLGYTVNKKVLGDEFSDPLVEEAPVEKEQKKTVQGISAVVAPSPEGGGDLALVVLVAGAVAGVVLLVFWRRDDLLLAAEEFRERIRRK